MTIGVLHCMLEIFDLVIGPRNMLGGFHFDICRSAHIYLRVLVVGQPGVEVCNAGVEEGVARDEGGLGGAGLGVVVVVIMGGSF